MSGDEELCRAAGMDDFLAKPLRLDGLRQLVASAAPASPASPPPPPAHPRVLLVEDMTTDGGSKVSFVEAIRETGATCAHTAVIFFYDIFPDTRERLGQHGISLHSLCTWWDVLAVAKEQETFDAETLAEVEKFLRNPAEWQAANG